MNSTFKFGFYALLVNLALNTVFFQAGILFEWVPVSGPVLWDNQPLGLHHVVVSTLIPGLLAPVLFWLLQRFSSQPVRSFHTLAAMVLMGSFFSPFSVPGLSGKVIVLLELMHISTAGFTIWFLTIRPFGAPTPVFRSHRPQFQAKAQPKSQPELEAEQVG
jgi:hypothetical protein